MQLVDKNSGRMALNDLTSYLGVVIENFANPVMLEPIGCLDFTNLILVDYHQSSICIETFTMIVWFHMEKPRGILLCATSLVNMLIENLLQ